MEQYIDLSLAFTEAYQKHQQSSPALREMAALCALYPMALLPLRKEDLFAGRLGRKGDKNTRASQVLPVDFGPAKHSQIGYAMDIPKLQALAKKYPWRAAEIEEMIAFWREESTFVKIYRAAEEELQSYLFPLNYRFDPDGYLRSGPPEAVLGSGFISGSYDTRIAGIHLDYRKLLTLGLPGLERELTRYEKINGASDFYTAGKQAVELVRRTLRYYEQQAEGEVAFCLRRLQREPPATLREAIQLVIVYSLLTHVENFGRMDVYLGDFLEKDLQNGTITEEEAITLLGGLWDFIGENCGPHDSRVILGGKGRPNEKNADRFALLAMETTRRKREVRPVLTLRLYEGQEPALFEKALDLISEGCIYPTLYNDDVFIQGVMDGMHLPYEDAVDYVPLGCGELVVAGKSIGSPNSTFRTLKALEATLHNGRDGACGELIGLQTGEPATFETYEQLEQALFAQLEDRLRLDAKLHRHNREVSRRETAFVLVSLLTEDCIARGKGLLEGGVRYYGANLEGFGLTDLADSLTVIKQLVYEQKRYTLPQLVEILDQNFQGHEKDRAVFLSCPKFGNGIGEVDDLRLRIEQFINRTADRYGRQEGFHYCTVANVNPGGITIGPATAASPNGRYCGTPMALSNSPTPGADTAGLPAMLRSTAKVDPKGGGTVTNMNLSRTTAVEHRAEFSALLRTYFMLGGMQLNINCFNKGDLENALREPEKYQHLIVRVSGYSARFTDLNAVTQKHIMERTLF